MHHQALSALLLATVTSLAACSGSAAPAQDPGSNGSTPSGGSTRGADAGAAGTPSESDASAPPTSSPVQPPEPSPDAGPITPAVPTTGKIDFHLLLGVAGSDTPGDSISLDGDKYTDLIVSNFVAGAMYGHLIQEYSPAMLFDRDYLYGSIFGQLLQENLATEDYVSTSSLIDSSPDQQAVMGAGQGGPYQINNYAADMVYGSYAPQGYSLVNYVAIQKNIGFSYADGATQYTKDTPAAFNDKYFGPILTAYFHFNDYVALAEVGPVGGYTPGWEPAYDDALTTFKALPGNFLDVVLNVAYNQGYYGTLLTSYAKLGASASAATLATVDGYGAVWGIDDTYQQYPYQVRYYLDQLYDNPVPATSVTATTTPANHVQVSMALLGSTFASVFTQLAYVDATSSYVAIPESATNAAFTSALAALGLTEAAALDLSGAADRAAIFGVLEKAIQGLETSLGTNFIARTTKGL